MGAELSAPELAARVKRLGREAGFDLCRITDASPLHVERVRYLEWLSAGRQGDMRWMTPDRAMRSADPTSGLPTARSVVCLGMSYWAGHRHQSGELMGRVARYAWGMDYHTVIGERLERFAATLRREFGAESRWYVDTGPAMDKALAARSGLGWYGKNTNILTEQFGSYVLLGEVITSLRLPADEPLRRDCGACRLCVVACPTGALSPDYSIDARKCISYLTIEHRAAIPVELRASIGSWVFGCDICQDVCPPSMEPYLKTRGQRRAWATDVRRLTSRSDASAPDALQADEASDEPLPVSEPLYGSGIRRHLDLRALLRLTHQDYLNAFRGTAIRRAKVWMLRRNAAVALGNVGDDGCVPDLVASLTSDDHPIVRGHAAWALGEIAGRTGTHAPVLALQAALVAEQDESVRSEVRAALETVLSQSAPLEV